MLKIIRTLLKDKKEKLYLPIFLMVIDSIGSIVLYLMLYFTVVNILQNTLTKTLILSLIHISEPTRPVCSSRMPSSA